MKVGVSMNRGDFRAHADRLMDGLRKASEAGFSGKHGEVRDIPRSGAEHSSS